MKRFFLFLLPLFLVAALDARAQDVGEPDVALEAPADTDDRAAYAAAVEAAEVSTALGTADGHIAAGERYLEAAGLAQASGDAELTPLAPGAYEAAVKSFVDAGGVYASQQAFGDAATQFERAAEAAGLAGNAELQARMLSNAATAHIQAENPARGVELYDEALALAPDNLDYQFVRAVALRGAGQEDAALEAFGQLATAAEAAGDTENLTRANDAAGRMYLARARDAIQAENYGAAIRALDQAANFLAEDDANLNTFYANAYYRQGVNHVRAEQWGPARTALQRAQEYGRRAGRDQIVQGAQQQLDYIRQIQG